MVWFRNAPSFLAVSIFETLMDFAATRIPATLPPNVRLYVSEFVARRRRVAVCRSVGIAAAFALAWMLAWCLVDRLLQLPGFIRLGLLLFNLTGVVVLLYRPVREALRRDVDWDAAAADIEGRNAGFAERLRTVTSQMLARPELRGSPHMLGEILKDVDREAAAARPVDLVPWKLGLAPWAVGALVAAMIAGLAAAPGLGLPRLMARSVRPLSLIDPVTTTNLDVQPGDTAVIQGSPLTIRAQAAPLRGAPVVHKSEDGAAWSQEPMEPAGDGGQFAFPVPAVDKDFRYFVTGGDATSHTFRVSAERRPAVAGFRVRYVFPAYTHKPPVTVNTTDGIFEAPEGTEATLDVIATEPLKDGALTVGDMKLPLDRTVDPVVRQAKFHVDRSAPAKLDLLSARNVPGVGPAGMEVRSDPDQPPIVTLVQPAGDLRLSPRDVVAIEYVVSDDYGVTSLALQTQVNSSAICDAPLRVRGDGRYQQGVYELDLAALPGLRIGDLVRVSLAGADGAGRRGHSAGRFITIAPRSIDVKTNLRLAEVRQALRLSRSLGDELREALAVLDAARSSAGGDAHDPAALSSVQQSLSTADETIATLRQSLLQAIVHSDEPNFSRAMARWADDVQVATAREQDAAGMVDSVAQKPSRDKLAALVDGVKQLQEKVKAVAEGEEAEVILAELDDLKAAEKQANDSRLTKYARRTREEIASDAADLTLDPGAGDFRDKLAALVQGEVGLLAQQQAVDFASAASAWLGDLAKPVREQPPLADRLAVAAQAEAVRPDADFVAARDLQLEGRAATMVEPLASSTAAGMGKDGAKSGAGANPQSTDGRAPVATPKPEQFPTVVAALQKDHELNRSGESGRAKEEVRAIRAAADDARKTLSAWAGQEGPLDATDSAALDQEALDQLMEANAAMVKGDYAKALANDAAVSTSKAAAEKHMAASAAGHDAGDKNESGDMNESGDKNVLGDKNVSGGPVAEGEKMPGGAESSARTTRAARDIADPARLRDDRGKSVAARETDQARRLAQLRGAQDKLRSDTEAAADKAQALAERQKAVAEAVSQAAADEKRPLAVAGRHDSGAAQADASRTDQSQAGDAQSGAPEAEPLPEPEPDGADDARGSAMAAIQAVQERLAAMPEELSQAQQAVAARIDAKARADVASKALDDAKGGEVRAAAGRVTEQARQDLAAAAARQQAAAAPVHPDVSEALSQSLGKFAPETSAAVEAIDQRLTPSLRELRQAMTADDAGAGDRATAQAREAIRAVQVALRQAQDAMIEKDPLASAKYYSQAAAKELARESADLQSAGQQQERASQALGRAWDRSVHAAAGGRLMRAPSLAALVDNFSYGIGLLGVARAAPPRAPSPAFPAAPEWGRLRARENDELNASVHEADPPGYEDALSAYFEALNKQRGRGGSK